MWKHYLRVALRSLRRQRLLSFINVTGLALGLACCLLLLLFVADEQTFDRVHAHGDRIGRLARFSYNPDGTHEAEPPTPYMPIPAGPALVAELPEVEQAVRLKRFDHLVRRGAATHEEEVVFADPAILDVFTFPLRRGDPRRALGMPNAVVLSEAAARKYFGDADPLGQALEVRLEDGFEAVTVTGVAAVSPHSTVRFDVLMPFERGLDAHPFMRERERTFDSSSTLTYVRLREGTSMEAVSAKLPAFVQAHFAGSFAAMRAAGGWSGDGPPMGYWLQPLHDIHLNPDVLPGLTPPNSPLYSWILGGIALAVLLIACINFMALTLGRSAVRAREVGVRKAMGARQGQLAGQFWGEALVLSALALLAGLGLALLFLPTFNALTGKTLSFDLVGVGGTAAGLAALALLTGLVAGSYPALALARLNPVETFRNRTRPSGGGFIRVLVVVQFALSMVLLVGAFVLGAQLRYLQTRDLGFDREQVAVVDISGLDGERVLERFRQALGGHPDVHGLTGASLVFGGGTSSYGFQVEGEPVEIVAYRVEPDFVETMGLDLVAGRDFDPAQPSDATEAVLVNEALARRFGWTEPVGEVIQNFAWFEVENPTVVGVVRDFHFQSLHATVEPALLTLDPGDDLLYVLARLRPGRTAEGLAALRATWEGLAPDLPLAYSFLDDDLDALYADEARWAQIVRYATAFALLVACLGLFGLASLTVAQRTKEIGIRKVLGASTGSLVALLSSRFAVLVAVSMLVAAPVAWFAAERWLEGFAYHIDLGPGVFLLAGGLALAVALLTVSTQALRAASADPLRSLRYE